MLQVTTPLLLLASALLEKAIAGLQDGSLNADEAQNLSRRATALNRVVDLAVRHGLDAVLRRENFDHLTRLRDEYRGRFPELARAIDQGLGLTEQSSQARR